MQPTPPKIPRALSDNKWPHFFYRRLVSVFRCFGFFISSLRTSSYWISWLTEDVSSCGSHDCGGTPVAPDCGGTRNGDDSFHSRAAVTPSGADLKLCSDNCCAEKPPDSREQAEAPAQEDDEPCSCCSGDDIDDKPTIITREGSIALQDLPTRATRGRRCCGAACCMSPVRRGRRSKLLWKAKRVPVLHWNRPRTSQFCPHR
ncbi:uncharacterized protein EV420DRAFT_871188 [Desarmillaria tabescens]|uniref:Uncharacterized protein n=1 Tax=Armillaria tabescens TaxID=1929756 RepID=A0AA39JT66_ARMTA|nr:uncharacterized protein EV420DRAFT_871188 [Desarmillaria tabescens]KAK0447371.1 hypothetical protein EV420DRAFT_871188 [Desarmillaria tabescens]